MGGRKRVVPFALSNVTAEYDGEYDGGCDEKREWGSKGDTLSSTCTLPVTIYAFESKEEEEEM